jgi:hypothetical protein
MSARRSESPFINRTCYWLGMVMTAACLGLIFAGNTEAIWRFEHIGIPLSWVMGALAMLAFLAFEVLDSTSPSDSPAHYLDFSAEGMEQESELS